MGETDMLHVLLDRERSLLFLGETRPVAKFPLLLAQDERDAFAGVIAPFRIVHVDLLPELQLVQVVLLGGGGVAGVEFDGEFHGLQVEFGDAGRILWEFEDDRDDVRVAPCDGGALCPQGWMRLG